MVRQSLAAVALSTLVANTVLGAEKSPTQIVTVFVPMVDDVALEASVVKADAEKTTYAVTCAPNVDQKSCGIPRSSWIFMQGPSTLSQEIHYSEWALPPKAATITKTAETLVVQTQSLDCKIDGANNKAQCDLKYTGTVDYSLVLSRGTSSIDEFTSQLRTMTVTAGVEKLASASNVPNTDDKITDAPTQTGASSTDAATTTDSDNAAPARATQKALVAFAAMVGGGALIL